MKAPVLSMRKKPARIKNAAKTTAKRIGQEARQAVLMKIAQGQASPMQHKSRGQIQNQSRFVQKPLAMKGVQISRNIKGQGSQVHRAPIAAITLVPMMVASSV